MIDELELERSPTLQTLLELLLQRHLHVGAGRIDLNLRLAIPAENAAINRQAVRNRTFAMTGSPWGAIERR